MARKKTRRTREAPREMAAVMFTDVHGYSSLAQRDEALAVRLLELKRTLADPLIAEHRGRLVKTIGDALMVEFKSALAAVRCATELQKRLHKHNKQVPEKERLIVRIGVHMGDVIRKDGDLLGDTVNIAARVEPQAEPGGVAFTQVVYDQIRGKFNLPMTSLGGFKLKGIDAEMPLYAVVFPWSGSSPKSTGSGFFVRLKQHHMFRIASWYATAAYVLVLVANAVFPDIGFTREDVRYLIGAVALGFPLVLTFGWMFIPPSKENPEQFSRWKRVRFRLGAVVSLVVVIFVALSGVYLWRFNAGRMGEISTKVTGTPSIVVLPFQKLGRVDDAMAADMQETIEDTFSNLGGLKVISHAALPPTLGSASALAEVFKVTGATLILQGSIEHTDAKSYYSVRMQLVSAAGAETLYSVMGEYAYDASSSDIAKQAAFSLAGPVRSLTLAVDGLTKGYATTKNQRALQLLRQALISFNYDDNGTAKAVTLLHEALAVDPNFAQAHAYLAVMEVWGGNDAQAKAAETEIAMAEKLAPGLPEAKLARGALQAWIYNDNAAADKTLESVQDTIGNRFMLHWTRAYVLRLLGRWDDALREYQTAEALDPYQPWPPESAAVLSFGKRDYDASATQLSEASQLRPLEADFRLWSAMVRFAQQGDVEKLAAVIDGDWSIYGLTGDDVWLAPRKMEILHLQGRHADVIKALSIYPHELLYGTSFGWILGRPEWVDSFTAESLYLIGKHQDAAAAARLHEPQVALEMPDAYEAEYHAVHLALLQVLSGDALAASKTVAPVLKRLGEPSVQWTYVDARVSSSAALVLAWAGQKQQAIDLLKRSLDATFGTHAAIVARDPVWRPLYTEPAFKALLAKYGQTLAYAK